MNAPLIEAPAQPAALTALEAARLSGLTLRDVARACDVERVDPARELVAHEAQRLAYVAMRKRTRPFRRAFGVTTASRRILSASTVAMHQRDAKAIREAVILGARTVSAVSKVTRLKQGRVRRIVAAEGITAVTA